MCSSVQSMIVERCIISDVQIAELLYQYHTLGFDNHHTGRTPSECHSHHLGEAIFSVDP